MRPPTRALIVLLWRAGLRINQVLSLAESGLDPARGCILIRRGERAPPFFGFRTVWSR
ncbi:MAG: hypothetical protein JO046_09895 [Solirubrobacterales bacterium]|nr:hypothetical protein [Solirubrobacterales bacterium]